MLDRLDTDNAALIQKLEIQLDRAQTLIDKYEAYYEGEQRLEQLGLAIPPELRRFVVIVNWPRVAVDAVEERLERTGFQLPGQRAADPGLWDLWLYNGLDELAVMGDRDALKLARSYRIIGSNDDDEEFPRITIESPREVTVLRDPKTLDVVAALKRYDVENGRATSATLYLPDETIWLDGQRGGWEVVERDRHGMDAVPVVPQVNRPRIGIPKDGRPLGTSEMVDVIPVTDAAARNLTNAQVAQETHAVPQRAVSGAKASDFVDTEGHMLPVWETYFGAVWALTNENAKPFQFAASDMVNFERMQDMYARQASAMSATPPNYFGLAADDAASADAIRARDARLNRKCERRIQTFSGVDKRTLYIAERIRTGDWNKDILRMRSLWDDPSTPTFAQKADAATKLAGGKPIIPVEQARRDLGYTPQEIADMIEMDKRAASLALEAMQKAMSLNQDQGAIDDGTDNSGQLADKPPVVPGQPGAGRPVPRRGRPGPVGQQ